jgi:hypothetical protein
MKLSMESASLHFELDLEHSCWNLDTANRRGMQVQSAHMRAAYRSRNGKRQALNDWRSAQVSEPRRLPSPHGPLQAIQVDFPPSGDGLLWRLHFALPEDLPLFLWRLEIENQGRAPVFLGRLTLLSARFSGLASPAFFSNGWGSWDYTGVYGLQDRYQRTRLGPFTRPMRVNAGAPEPGAGISPPICSACRATASRQAVLASFLSQCEHFGSVKRACRWMGQRSSYGPTATIPASPPPPARRRIGPACISWMSTSLPRWMPTSRPPPARTALPRMGGGQPARPRNR